MAAPRVESRIIDRLMPSLFHIALVRTALPLFNEFDIETLDSAFREIHPENSADSNKGIQDSLEAKRAKEKLLFIPAHLRRAVFQAVMGMNFAVFRWKWDHDGQIELNNQEGLFYWGFDGLIDRTKTALQLVLNTNISIRERFNFACMYCLEKNVQALWAEIEASGEIFETSNSMTRFWVRWMGEGCQVPWLQAAQEYLEPPRNHWIEPWPRYSSFFPLLSPEDKERFLNSLKWAAGDDVRFCLYLTTKEEEEQILKTGAFRILHFYLYWPMQSFFLETVEKLWDFIDFRSYCLLAFIILNYMGRKDFDYCQLFMDFWIRSPSDLRERAEEFPPFREQANAFFKKIRQKKKKQKLHSDANGKKWIRTKNGRLQSNPK